MKERKGKAMGESTQELYEKRMRRFEDAVQLRVPDRVPFLPHFTFFPARYAGITCQEAMFDCEKLARAWKKTVLDFQPDMYNSFVNLALGPMLETLQCRYLKWPGNGVPSHQGYQFVEEECMKAEEYDEFLFDPTDFVLRKFLPRAYGSLQPLQKLPCLPSVYYTRFLTSTAVLGLQDVAEAAQSLLKSGVEAQRVSATLARFAEEMSELGFPSQYGGVAYAPFDYLGDFLRGTRGVMLDMFRHPQKLLQSTEKLLPYILSGALAGVKATGVKTVFIPLHKGLDGFMSPEQFRVFYWPTLRKVIVSLIQEGAVPSVLWEGDCTSRLEMIRDIPKGKAVYAFERTDIFRAKEILGDTVCIRGNVPPALLNLGSPEEVREYCKKLIRIVGKGGGFLLDGAIGIPDEAKSENLRAMAHAVKDYGLYS
jgi:uroporphyrinogen-III decarboxylase